MLKPKTQLAKNRQRPVVIDTLAKFLDRKHQAGKHATVADFVVGVPLGLGMAYFCIFKAVQSIAGGVIRSGKFENVLRTESPISFYFTISIFVLLSFACVFGSVTRFTSFVRTKNSKHSN